MRPALEVVTPYPSCAVVREVCRKDWMDWYVCCVAAINREMVIRKHMLTLSLLADEIPVGRA